MTWSTLRQIAIVIWFLIILVRIPLAWKDASARGRQFLPMLAVVTAQWAGFYAALVRQWDPTSWQIQVFATFNVVTLGVIIWLAVSAIIDAGKERKESDALMAELERRRIANGLS